ncbi:MAG: DUF202 domain-containing protein [Terracoccus sp.]
MAVDRGLQQERTALAWSRTGLALFVSALVVGRLSLGSIGAAVLVPVALAAASSGWVAVVSWRHGRGAGTSAREEGFGSILPDGRVPGLVALTVAVLCLCELASVLVG